MGARLERKLTPTGGLTLPSPERRAHRAPRPTTADITANDLRTRLYQIADDSMLGRRMGEPGNYLTTAYIAAEFQRLGLRPAGEGGTYFQDLPYGPIGFDLAQSRLAIGDEPLEVESDWVPIVPAGRNSMGGAVSFDGVATVFAGRWGDAARLAAAGDAAL